MIVAAAIRYKGKIFTGKRHNNIIKELVEYRGYKPPITISGGREDGFIDDHGNFLTREEAGEHAIECGQIKKLRYNQRMLFSEDLY